MIRVNDALAAKMITLIDMANEPRGTGGIRVNRSQFNSGRPALSHDPIRLKGLTGDQPKPLPEGPTAAEKHRLETLRAKRERQQRGR